jgi:hypothetical protein
MGWWVIAIPNKICHMFFIVVALLDERGREVTPFAEGDPINSTTSFVEINSCLLRLLQVISKVLLFQVVFF